MVFEIGDKVQKKSGKPFKSTMKIAQIIGFERNPYTKKMGALLRDGSIVDLGQLEKVD